MKFLLTWAVYPGAMRRGPGDSDVPTRRIELVVRTGATARRFATDESYSVSYATAMQSRCQDPHWRLPPPMVAQLSMNGGGNLDLTVRREGDQLTLVREISSDGLCEPSPCPVHTTVLAHIPVPAKATFEERFHVVEGPGGAAEHDEFCEARR